MINIGSLIRTAQSTCVVCKKEKKDVHNRRIKNPSYQGPCGDSFCYASCDMDCCITREFSISACDACTKKLEKQVAKEGKKKT